MQGNKSHQEAAGWVTLVEAQVRRANVSRFHTGKCKYWWELVLIVMSGRKRLGPDSTWPCWQCLNRNISLWQESNKQQHRNTEDYILMRLTDDNNLMGYAQGSMSLPQMKHNTLLSTHANTLFSTVKCRSLKSNAVTLYIKCIYIGKLLATSAETLLLLKNNFFCIL